MNFAGLVFLIVAHYFSGKGFLRLFKLELKPMETFCLSLITGVPLLSFVPCIMQLMHVPLTASNCVYATSIFTLIFTIPLFLPFRRPQFAKFVIPEFYEWPFLVVVILLTLLSVWRCYYYPVFARDMLTGPELLAEFAVREKTMLSSVFNIDLGFTKINDEVSLTASANNNIFKSPYITGLQILYKLLVQPFGQLWMSVLYIPFQLWLYYLLTQRIHRFFASLMLMLFVITPDLFAYSYVMLYDYSNMIFFFMGFFFLMKFLENEKFGFLAWSAVAFGLATFIRGETLILVMFAGPLLLYHYYKKHTPIKTIAIQLAVFGLIPYFFNFLTVNVFLKNFVPFKFSLASLLNRNLSNVSLLWQRLQEINDFIVFGKVGLGSYGYFLYFFMFILVVDIVFIRRFNREALMFLYAVGIVYFGLAFMGYIIPANTLENTTKRGFFKVMPFVLFYMANSSILLKISDWLTNGSKAKPPAKATVRTAPRPATAGAPRPVAKAPARPPVKKK